MKNVLLLSCLFIVTCNSIFGQRGKDGAKIVSGREVVNAYTNLIVGAGIGNTGINVANSALNNNFTSSLAPGDLLMIIQVQGAVLDNTNQFISSWGSILNYGYSGNYEFVQVSTVLSATAILIDCPLTNNYIVAGNTMVIRVPRYSSLTINALDTLTADPWNGTNGGVLAVEVDGVTTINAGGVMDVSELGFRGGSFDFASTFGGLRFADNDSLEGAEKGEGIGGDQIFYSTSLAGRYCRGAAANGGGGGNAHNAGGAGGANAGDPLNWNTGTGVPDPTYDLAWALETPSIVGIVSSGGGRGGYTHAGADANELTLAPGLWVGDGRHQRGGLGGRPLDYSTGRIFLGGGGGAGDGEDNTDDATPGSGGNGGGIVFLFTYGDVNGSGTINSNGQNGFNCEGNGGAPAGFVTGKDAAGGAGAGGTIIVKTTGTVSGVVISANGGAGGNQVLKAGTLASVGEAEGPGGGGGGGYIAISSGAPTRNASGGVSGTTDSPYMNNSPTPPNNFAPNGATDGGAGMPNETIDAFDIMVNIDTICINTTSTLTATITGTDPGGIIFEWYDAPIGGTLLFTGNPFVTPLLAANATYYVKACPAPFRVLVPVVVNACPTITASFSSTDSTLCFGDCIDFTDLSTGGPAIGWTWYFPGSSTPTSTAQNPLNICYNGAGSFDVSLVVDDGTGTDSLYMPGFINVNALPVVTANATSTSICSGDPATLTGGGATSYTWDNGVTDGIAFNPLATTLYTVTGTDGNLCQNTDTITVFVNPLPFVTANATSTSICSGDPVTLTGGGATSYTWDNGVTDGIAFNPLATTLYTVTGTDGNLCQNTDTITVFVNPLPIVTANATSTSICSSDPVTLTGGGATSYTWDNGVTDGIAFNPLATTLYTVTGTDGNLCQNTDTVTVFVNPLPTVTANTTNTSICSGDPVTLSGGGATSYTWNNGVTDGIAFNPLATTLYTVTGTDGNLCQNTDTVTVFVNPLPTVTANTTNTSICSGDPVTLSGSGATSYTWDNGVTDGMAFNPLATTLYTVTGTDGNLCQNTDTITVFVNPLPIVIANATSTSICSGDPVTLTGGGATSYTWDNGVTDGISFNPLATTLYTITGTDANLCQNTDTITVFVTPCGAPPIASFSATDSSICVGDCIDFNDLSAGAPSGWTWYFFGSTTLNYSVQNPTSICYNTAGSFDVALVDTNAFGQDSIFISNFITVNALPIIAANATNTSICSSDPVTLTGGGGTSYTWDNGVTDGIVFNPLTTTLYTVTGTDANLCQNTDTITVFVNPCGALTVASFSATDSIICLGDCIDFNDLSTGAPSGWTWFFFGATTLNSSVQNPTSICYNTAGSFDVALVDTNSTGQDSIFIANFITVNALPIVTANTTNNSICSGNPVTLTGSGATSYTWDNGVLDGIAFVPLATTTYTVTGIDGNSCSNTDQISITVNLCTAPIAAIGTSTINLCIFDCVDFTDLSTGGTPTNWSWYFFGANPISSGSQNPNNICYDSIGTFDVALLVTNAFGTDSIFMANYIIVDSCNSLPTSIIIPNIFSPNGDGQNDLFNVSGTGIQSINTQVFNRWGSLMFQTNLMTTGWDGRTTSGTKATEGTYFYIITVQTMDQNETYKGTVTLIR